MPSVIVPLNIFEARYRVLFNTLLAGAEGLEEGLVNHQSPFCGSRIFGMCWATSQGLTSVGTTLHIDNHRVQPDGRMLVTTKGRERFQIQSIVQEKPVLICDVEMLEGDDTHSVMALDIAAEVRRVFKDLVTLNAKIKKAKVVDDDLSIPDLDEWPPEQLSYHVASMFPMNPMLQQSLLEETTTIERLRKERDLLQSTLDYTSAQHALRSAFADDKPEDKAAEGQQPEQDKPSSQTGPEEPKVGT
ncbi:hypothetical protein WJX84_003410 [Apatococcus fuscideae]